LKKGKKQIALGCSRSDSLALGDDFASPFSEAFLQYSDFSAACKAQPLNAAATEIVIGLIAVGAALGIGIFYPSRQPSSLTGCTVSAENGLQLRNEGDIRRLPLSGDLANGRERRCIRASPAKRKKTDPN
jgi:hypothetical protein